MQHLQSNTTLQGGKYRIERVLGQGGFGITYLAYSFSNNKHVAIKELFISGINDRSGYDNMVKVSNAANIYSFTQQKEKFKKEAKRLFNLNNPHIVKVYDMFEENGTAYYVMEYIKGTSLANSINKSSKDELTVFSYLNQILDALSAIHTKNLWHLDIKPANILVSKGTIILIDFGASKHIDRNSTITTSSALAFTPGFAAPEQLQCDMGKFGPWTDFYALGATLYQIITLHMPPSFTDILSDGDTAFSFPEFISERMKHIILWMMKPNRRERPQNVDEIVQNLYYSNRCRESTIIERNLSSSNISVPISNNEDEIRREAYKLKDQLEEKLYQKNYFIIGVFGAIIGGIIGMAVIGIDAVFASLPMGFLAFWYPIRIYVHYKGKNNIKKWKEHHLNDPRCKYL